MAKILTVDNFLLPDPLAGAFVSEASAGLEHRRSAVDWAHAIHAFRLEAEVPEGVRHRFELARGVLTYGFFWYPLWAHGVVEAGRAAEAALEAVCAARRAPKSAKDAESRIAWLAQRGAVDSSDVERWRDLARLSAAPVPPDSGLPVGPARALEVLGQVADLINRVYAASGPKTGV